MDSGNKSTCGNRQYGVEDYIQFQESLKQRCCKLKGVSGVSKLERKLHAEMKFLISLQKLDKVTQKSHLKSSNLSHFSSLVHAAELLPGVVQVLQPFVMPTRSDSLVVDIVAARGHVWVKVIARKAQALHLVWSGQGQFGERDLVSQAEEYLQCATRHPYEFSVPQVHFAFYNQVTQPLADCLKKMGVVVWGVTVPDENTVQAKLESLIDDDIQLDINTDGTEQVKWGIQGLGNTDEDEAGGIDLYNGASIGQSSSISSEGSPSSFCCSDYSHLKVVKSCDTLNNSEYCGREAVEMSCTEDNLNISEKSLKCDFLFLHLVTSPPVYDQTFTVDQPGSSVTRVNLDITALIALVSAVTNGNCHYVFHDKVLTLQAKEERDNSVLPVLEKYLRGKEIFACETAVSSFKSILDILGGQAEKRRAAELLARISVVPDQPSKRAMELECQGRIKERSKVIFGTGDTLHAATMTSNMGFVRAAKSQGVVFSVFLHPARALTEEKELSGVPLLKEQQCAASP